MTGTARMLLRRSVDDDLAGLVAEGIDRHEAWARALWSALAEPSDGVAGALVAGMGAARALAWAVAPHDLRATAELCGVRPKSLASAPARWAPRLDEGIDHVFDVARRARLRLLSPDDPHWPRGLDDLGVHAPHALWVRGSLTAARPAVALVGARAATVYGGHVAAEFASDLARRGVVVVSGAAYGIDGTAHRAALAAGGETIAVLAGGCDRAYPSAHAHLLARVAESGGVVSEVAPGTAPTRWRFLQRNRLIAAIADAVVVVEAGARSGTLNTAGHAAEIGRPLGAVPGPVTSAASAGCHDLLRNYDARCVTDADEVLELAGVDRVAPMTSDRLPPEHIRVLDALSFRVRRTTEAVAARCGMSLDETRSVLGLLSLEGRAEGDASGWVGVEAP